jgi:hypothetical protein
MRACDGYSWADISATPETFILVGGIYELSGVGTWSGGGIEVQMLGPNGSTYLSAPTPFKLTANGRIQAYCAPGTYQLTVTTATALYAAISRVPIE